MRLFHGGADDDEAAAYIQLHWRERHESILRAVRAREREEAALAEAALARTNAASVIQRCWRAFFFRRALRRLVAFGLDAVGPGSWPSVSTIQRCWRSSRLRRRWQGIINTINERFLVDEQLRSQAAQGAEWYTPAMMLRRERMYRDPVVQAELERAWQAVSAASARAVPSDEHDGAATIGWQQYAQLSRKLYLCLMKRSDPHEAFLLAKLDWERDTRGWPDAATPLMERVIDRATFFRSWFELADVNTDDMEEETYGRFIERTIRLIVRTDARSGACMLRSDAEVMNLVVKNGGLHIESRARMSRAPAYAPPKENARFHQQTIASKAAQRDRFTRAPVLAASTGLSPRSATQGLSAASPMRASKSQPAMLTRAQLTEPPDRQPARANDARPHELPEDAPPARAAATAPGAEPPSRSPPLAPLLRHARTAVALLPPLPALALKRTGTMPATAWHSTPDWHSTRDSAPHALAEAAAAGPVPETVDAPSKPRLRRRAQSKPDNPKPDSLTLSRKAGALALALSDDERGAAPRLRELVGLPARERRAQSLDGLALQAPLPAIRSARSHSHAGLVALAEQPRRRAVSLGGPRSVGQRRLSRPVVGLAIRTSAARAPGLFARAPQAVVSPTSGVHVAHRRESDASVVGGGGKGGKAAAPRWIGMSLSSVAR